MNLTWRSCIFHPATRAECRIHLSQRLNVTAKTKQSYLTSLSFNHVILSHRHVPRGHIFSITARHSKPYKMTLFRSIRSCLPPPIHTYRSLKKHNLGEIFKSSSHKIKKRAKTKSNNKTKQNQNRKNRIDRYSTRR